MTIVINMQHNSDSNQTATHQPLRSHVRSALTQYFQQLEGQDTINLYQLVLGEIEPPLMEAVMEYTRGNQSKAAVLLGLSRSTLRKKLKQYQLEEI